MKITESSKTLLKLARAGRKNQFIDFKYTKESGETSMRKVRFGGDIAAKFARDGQPVKGENGRGNWISGARKGGTRGMIVESKGRLYLRGTDCRDSKSKIFLLSGISL